MIMSTIKKVGCFYLVKMNLKLVCLIWFVGKPYSTHPTLYYSAGAGSVVTESSTTS